MNFNTLKKIVPITAVLHDKGLLKTFRRQGERLVGPCPVHGGDNPNAFVVNLKKNLWYCFTGCNSGGDIIDLVCRLEGKNFRQTLHYLTSLAGCPHGRFSFSPPASKLFKPFSQRLPLNHFTAWLPAKKLHQEQLLFLRPAPIKVKASWPTPSGLGSMIYVVHPSDMQPDV